MRNVLALFFVLMSFDAHAVVALVSGQVVQGNATFGTNTVTLSLPNNPTSGNLVVVAIDLPATPGTITVHDSASNAYTPTTSSPATLSSAVLGIYYFVANGTATKAITITGTTATGGFVIGWIAEFSGTATTTPLESDATVNFGGPGTNVNTPSITTTNNGDVLVSVTNTFGTLSTVNSPWNIISAIDGSGTGVASYTVKATAGAQGANYTQGTSSNWDGVMAAFKAAAGAPTAAPNRSLMGVGK